MLTGEPSIVEAAASMLKAIVTRNPKAMIRLYSTGAFYFAIDRRFEPGYANAK